MERIFTKEELKRAKNIVTSGLAEATKSLGFLVKSETRLELGDEFSISETFPTEFLSKKGGIIFLLHTKLLGDLKGVSYLLFSEDEVHSIMKATYPNKQFDEEKYKRKLESLILEIDNIITAGVMSQFANSFNYRTYGGVPALEIVNYDNAIEIIKKESEENEFLIKFNAQLIAERSNIQADFVWFVDEAFVKGVKKINGK